MVVDWVAHLVDQTVEKMAAEMAVTKVAKRAMTMAVTMVAMMGAEKDALTVDKMDD